MARLAERFEKEILPKLLEEFGYRNVMEVPRLKKIVLNMGLGDAIQNQKMIDVGRSSSGSSAASGRW